MRYRLSPRCQSARERSVNDETERRKAGELERQRRREEAETSFQSWLREKQREAAEQRRQQRLKNAAQPANEVSVVTHTHTHTHTHPFNGPLSRTTQVSRYQKGKPSLDFTEARDSEWQWHQLGHMQVCTSLQPDNHASTPPLSLFPAAQPTASKHCDNSLKFIEINSKGPLNGI